MSHLPKSSVPIPAHASSVAHDASTYVRRAPSHPQVITSPSMPICVRVAGSAHPSAPLGRPAMRCRPRMRCLANCARCSPPTTTPAGTIPSCSCMTTRMAPSSSMLWLASVAACRQMCCPSPSMRLPRSGLKRLLRHLPMVHRPCAFLTEHVHGTTSPRSHGPWNSHNPSSLDLVLERREFPSSQQTTPTCSRPNFGLFRHWEALQNLRASCLPARNESYCGSLCVNCTGPHRPLST